MKVIKVELFIVDHDDVGASAVKDLIESARYPNRCISPNVITIDWREIGDWDDTHPLNHYDTMKDELARLFSVAARQSEQGQDSIDDLVDFVCAPLAAPPAPQPAEPSNAVLDAIQGVANNSGPGADAPFSHDPLGWAVWRWESEVKNRPLVNVHRRTLDDTWRQVIRHFGGDPDKLVGPSHDDLLAQQRTTP